MPCGEKTFGSHDYPLEMNSGWGGESASYDQRVVGLHLTAGKVKCLLHPEPLWETTLSSEDTVEVHVLERSV